MHDTMQCLTAIRNYSAGARRALADNNREKVAYALAEIERQVGRAHDLVAQARSANAADPP